MVDGVRVEGWFEIIVIGRQVLDFLGCVNQGKEFSFNLKYEVK